jgi:hypothetical protein
LHHPSQPFDQTAAAYNDSRLLFISAPVVRMAAEKGSVRAQQHHLIHLTPLVIEDVSPVRLIS